MLGESKDNSELCHNEPIKKVKWKCLLVQVAGSQAKT